MELTEEQKKILDAAKNESCDLIIDAGPGAAKTTILALIAKNSPDKKFLYLAYNKKIVEEAKEIFPSNVEVKTVHGLAYRGQKMWLAKHKLERQKKGYYNEKIHELAEANGFDYHSSGISLNTLTRYVRDAITNFTASEQAKLKPRTEAKRFALELAIARSVGGSDPAKLEEESMRSRIYKTHLERFGFEPSDVSYSLFIGTFGKIKQKLISIDKALKVAQLKKLFTAYVNSEVIPNEELRTLLSSDLEALKLVIADFWRAQANRKDDMVMDHGTYLKQYQMSNPSLDYSGGLLLDEWQDANPVMKSITMNQKTRKIVVGDQHQAIYRFTGAVNAIEDAKTDLKDSRILTLTNSFRFGPDIAYEVNKALDFKRILEPGSVHPSFVIKGVAPIREASQQEMILSRTNMGVIEAAIKHLAEGKKVFIGDSISEHFIQQLKDTYYLAKGDYRKIANEIIQSYSNIDDYKEECRLSGDIEGTRAIHIVDNLGESFEMSIDSLSQLASGLYKDDFDIEIVTAHKAKGLGRSRVRIWDDFIRVFYNESGPKSITDISIDEINLWFVAVSRAKDVLDYPSQIRRWIDTNLDLKNVNCQQRDKFEIAKKIVIGPKKGDHDASHSSEKSI